MLLSAGSNAHGQLSNTSVDDSHLFSPCSFLGGQPGALPAGRKLLHLTFGANHTLALLEVTADRKTELWGCGDGKSGQLGLSYNAGATMNTTVFRPLQFSFEQNDLAGYLPRLVEASWETTYVVLSCEDKPDVLISMGANDFGDLGIGAKRAGKLPAKDFHVVGFDHLLDASVDKASLVMESLASGQHHVIVKLKTASRDLVVGWGTSRHGQLGDVEKPFLSAPAIISTHKPDDPLLFAALGHQHTVFLHSSGTVSSFGSNRKDQLEGIGAVADVQVVDCTWNGTYIRTGDGPIWELLSAGHNAHGQLGRGGDHDLGRLLQFVCGSEHVLASFLVPGPDATTEVWGWGWNEHGNLGLGTTTDVHIPVKLWPLESSQASHRHIRIWAGSGTSWIFAE
ncbi:regulator of chromosome condensation 1/beta-lactamase-inhibitor protein II [Mycena pura]|uniref:Regulator of chromosome condensation 1/beta-lactamase-inhibitor protein II n=1 Tax=Mycena pura TaxID=153505 RepID=A0AAD6Y3I1_9AGAR|nr:regulator of chromosome condensation 1/beta-lactamase-inhibitor protein II [Mycena pura]